MAGDWRIGAEAEKSENMCYLIGAVVFIGGWITSYRILSRLTADKSENEPTIQ